MNPDDDDIDEDGDAVLEPTPLVIDSPVTTRIIIAPLDTSLLESVCQKCDRCGEVLADNEGQKTADTIVCARCVRELVERNRFPYSIGHIHPY